jgi:hypothetical protein
MGLLLSGLRNYSVPRNTTCWKLAGTKSLRLASAALWEIYGTNLTNIEKELRKLYWADPGKKQVQTDQAGAEALIVAFLCKAGKFRDLFINGVKPHVFVAMHVFLATWKLKIKDIDVESFINTPIPELKKREGWKTLDDMIKASDNWPPRERYYFFAKQMCHSLNYDAREFAFRMNVLEKSRGKVVLTKQQAQDYIAKYHGLFPEIHAWHRDIEEELRYTGMITNLFGYPFIATEDPTDRDLKEWYAIKPQSTVGCITHIAITQMQQFIEDNKLDWDVWNNNHDSMVVQCPEAEEVECGRKSREFMEQELTSPRGEKFRMRSECQSGWNWSPWKKDKNEKGLLPLEL